jgi:uncharacterized protein (DUF849 family)
VGRVLQACLNGARQPGTHPALPVTPERLAEDAVAVAELGVTSLHLHPRDVTGAEVLAGPEVATVVATVRAAAPGVEIGVTTAAAIEPNPYRRSELIRSWAPLAAGRPDIASVNVHEGGWLDVAKILHDAGIAIELGIFHMQAARRLQHADLPPGTVRILAEVRPDKGDPIAEAEALLCELESFGLPILLHGEDDSAWPVLTYAARLELDTRIGLEDTLLMPDGTVSKDNCALVEQARRTQRALAPS